MRPINHTTTQPDHSSATLDYAITARLRHYRDVCALEALRRGRTLIAHTGNVSAFVIPAIHAPAVADRLPEPGPIVIHTHPTGSARWVILAGPPLAHQPTTPSSQHRCPLYERESCRWARKSSSPRQETQPPRGDTDACRPMPTGRRQPRSWTPSSRLSRWCADERGGLDRRDSGRGRRVVAAALAVIGSRLEEAVAA
ncbi:hypothetical protein B0T44_13275 [Nocardia donostiensis]|uniref:Uncharacterized protein n=1 Tax=Nocardia donostiensis TaxID=1538463 RepID=A0A1W0BAX5_9NOCA|nr:hypothetical protein B0T46_21480 [Nocardia donostiensis]OQS19566.1 hypothetical protein B0T44_13275 [Nocardia donostiensis]